MLNVPKLHLFFFRLQTYPDQTFSRNRFSFLSLALRIACWETMMWFWKSSSASGICTVVDMRLQILQRKLDKGAENAVRVWSPWSPCPQQTQMFQPDPDVLIFDLGGILMEEVNPWSRAFKPGMNYCADNDKDMKAGQWGRSRLIPSLPAETWKLMHAQCAQVWESPSVFVCLCRWGHTCSKKSEFHRFSAAWTYSHKSVTGQFLTPASPQLITSFKAQKTLSFK